MVAKLSEPQIINDEDINPRHDWSRAIYAPGVMAVDFEERIDFRRLHRYRLARTRQALKNSELGALLTFDANNIRYITSTNIGEWSRDKMCRFALLAGDESPHLWDFGSAAAHHRLYAPWLEKSHCHAGMLGLRGAVAPEAGLMQDAAKEIKALLEAASGEAGDSVVSGSRRTLSVAPESSTARSRASECTRSSWPRVAAGASCQSTAGMSSRSVWMTVPSRSGRSGCPAPGSWAMQAGCV